MEFWVFCIVIALVWWGPKIVERLDRIAVAAERLADAAEKTDVGA